MVAVVVLVSGGLVWGAVRLVGYFNEQKARVVAGSPHTTYAPTTLCSAQDLSVKVSAPESVSAGAGLTLSLDLSNEGPEACLLDLSESSLAMVVSSGGVVAWDSMVCPAGDWGQSVLLPGTSSTLPTASETPTSAAAGLSREASVTMRWDGKVAGAGCAADKAQVASAGFYHVRVTMGDTVLEEDRTFQVL